MLPIAERAVVDTLQLLNDVGGLGGEVDCLVAVAAAWRLSSPAWDLGFAAAGKERASEEGRVHMREIGKGWLGFVSAALAGAGCLGLSCAGVNLFRQSFLPDLDWVCNFHIC